MWTALENLKKEGFQEGYNEGFKIGYQIGLLEIISVYREAGYTDDVILKKLINKFQLNIDHADASIPSSMEVME